MVLSKRLDCKVNSKSRSTIGGGTTIPSPGRSPKQPLPGIKDYMIGKLAPNSTHFTRGFVKYVSGRGHFRGVPSQNGDKLRINRVRLPILLVVS